MLTIAVDFDGTIVENRYPGIGKPILFAFETLLKLQEEGHMLILWTYRCGKELDEAVEFCKKKGLNFYAVNNSYPEEVYEPQISRKIQADLFIDDRNVGGLMGWGEVYQLISKNPNKKLTNKIKKKSQKSKKGIFHFFK